MLPTVLQKYCAILHNSVVADNSFLKEVNTNNLWKKMISGGIIALPLSMLQSLIRKTQYPHKACLPAADFIQIHVP